MFGSPSTAPLREENERFEGTIDEGVGLLSVDLEDSDIIDIIGSQETDSVAWWNSEYKLDEVRKRGEEYYLNESYDEKELYSFQVPFKDNRIITAIETLVPLAVDQRAEPVVTEADDTDTSRQLSSDLGSVLMALYEDLGIKASLAMVVRHILVGKRVGVLKYRFDPTLGEVLPDGSRKGAIVVETVRPEKIVIAQGASDKDDVSIIFEHMEATLEDLIYKFPDKKSAIFRKAGIKQGTTKQLARRIGYVEVWFSYRDKGGQPQEGACWKWDSLVLGKIKNPNWNYDSHTVGEDGKVVRLNFLDRPRKPYIFFNHLNLGKHIIDPTSLMDQAQIPQDVLNKRGRQIVESADHASGGLVFNEQMISQEDARKIIGDPMEKVMVDGDVREAATRLPFNPLPAYVVNDKFDARAIVDNLFGSNAPIRGESSSLKTLGEAVMSQRANIGRLQTLADSLEDGMDRLYRALVQMMKVYWDEPEILRYRQAEGKTQFIEWNRDKIEDGVDVRVKSGTALPKDKFAIRNETIQSIAILDPLSIAEGLDKANPKEFARRLTYYRFFMDKYLAEFLGEDGEDVDSKALADIQALLSGQIPPEPENVSQEYLMTFDQFMSSGGFKQIQDPAITRNIIDFVERVSAKAKSDIGESPESSEASPVEAPGTPGVEPATENPGALPQEAGTI